MENSNETSENRVDQALSAICLTGLIVGFRSYVSTWGRVLRYRGRLAEFASATEPPIGFKSSVVFLVYGILVTFILYLPFIKVHGLQLTKVHFILQFLYIQVIYVLVMHISAKVFQGKGSLKDTTAVYCTWLGVCNPTLFLLNYPIFFYVPVTDFLSQSSVSAPSLPTWIQIWVVIVFLFMIVAFFLLVLRWAATVHKVKTWQLLLGLLFVCFPLMALHNHFVAPYVSMALELTSEFLSSLL
jgi:hypothetical protein